MHLNVYKHMTTEALANLMFACEAAMEAGNLTADEHAAVEADRNNVRAELYWGRGVHESDLRETRR